jgi:hypothetical protein
MNRPADNQQGHLELVNRGLGHLFHGSTLQTRLVLEDAFSIAIAFTVSANALFDDGLTLYRPAPLSQAPPTMRHAEVETAGMSQHTTCAGYCICNGLPREPGCEAATQEC